ncbi:MAG TPA: type II toxin-antitoxin system VapC family toxin [Actinobacteria bacterium]|nr:type II toxin-antitoxin system VapC family toxin [Actinomycetota bacterium]
MRKDKPRYLLDTSALLTFLEGEGGAETVKDILLLTRDDKADVFISFASLVEVYYIILQEEGEEIADLRFVALMELPVQVLKSLEETFILTAGRFKAVYPISFADAVIAAHAQLNNAILVHKDPEFLSIKDEVKQEVLPFKK